jgi:hypothetical protein
MYCKKFVGCTLVIPLIYSVTAFSDSGSFPVDTYSCIYTFRLNKSIDNICDMNHQERFVV